MFLSKPRVQYKTVTFEEKVAAIREVEKGVQKKAQIAKDLQIPPKTLSTYLEKKENILNSITNENLEDQKRVRGPENTEVDECVCVILDESAAICGELTDQEMLAEVTTRKMRENSSDEEEVRPEVSDKPIPTPSEALDQLHELRRYVEGQANISDSLFQALFMLHGLHYYKLSTEQDS